MKVKKPVFTIFYENEDITADIADHIESIVYRDRQHGYSDDIEITIIDDEHIWKSDLFPRQGDLISLSLGYEGEELLDCGSFEIDAPGFNLHEPLVTLRAVSTTVKKSLNEQVVKAYIDITLKKIIEEIGNTHELSVIGNIADLKFKRRTQNATDLEFLRSLADDYGYIFKVVKDAIIFTPYSDIEEEDAALFIDRAELLEGSSLETGINGIYKRCEVNYFRKGKLYSASAEDPDSVSENILTVKERCENNEQAQAMAEAHLFRKNRMYTQGSISTEGNTQLVSGNNLELTGLFRLNGIYQTRESRHMISGKESAYTTESQIYRVRES